MATGLHFEGRAHHLASDSYKLGESSGDIKHKRAARGAGFPSGRLARRPDKLLLGTVAGNSAGRQPKNDRGAKVVPRCFSAVCAVTNELSDGRFLGNELHFPAATTGSSFLIHVILLLNFRSRDSHSFPITTLEMASKNERDSERTRSELVGAGRKLFAELGYAEAGTEAIVALSGKTRGALYHHYGNKKGLFQAVVEQLQDEIAVEVSGAASSETSAINKIRAGFRAYLDACLRPEVGRIVLIDGPAVLGWSKWHEIDQRHAFGLTLRAIQHAMENNKIERAPVDAMTRVLLGAVTQASLDIVRSDDPQATRRELGEVIDLILTRLALDT